jgi:tetratricopeptide (TPR) repeat protein
VFAGEAFVQLPITTDRSAARMFAASVDTRTVGAQGTAIGAAIDLARSSFAADSPGGKAILVISDGENHEDDADGAARAAVEAGCVVHTIGMGTVQGGPIPVKRNGQVQGFHTDRGGRTVVSALNEDMLRGVAEAGNGVYVRAGQGSYGIDEILNNIQGMEKGTTGTYTFTAHEDRFQVPLVLALVLLLIALLLPESRPASPSRIRIAQLLPVLLLLAACGDAQERAVDDALRSGEAFYRKGDLNAALEQYEQAPEDHRTRYNAGVVLHQLGRLEEAADRFEQAAVLADSAIQRARAHYDLGHTWQLRAIEADTLSATTGRAIAALRPGGDITEQVRQAVMLDSMLTVQRNAMLFSDSALLESRTAYRQALRSMPADEDARHNLTQVQNTMAARVKAAEERKKAEEAQQGKDLTALARSILAKADSLVARYAFDDALKTLQQGLQREPTLIQRKDYSDKLETVTNAARP